MSGPKISVYSLERERKRILEKIRKCDQKRTEFVIENRQLISDLSEMLREICNENKKIKSLHHQTESSVIYAESLTGMEKILSEFISDAVSVQSINTPKKNEKVILSREELNKHEESLSNLTQLNLKAKKIDDLIRSQFSTLHKESLDSIISDIPVITNVDFSSSDNRLKMELTWLKNRLLTELEEKISLGNYEKGILNRLDEIRRSIRNAPNISVLKNFENLTLKSFYSQLDTNAAKAAKCKVLREVYLQTCNEAHISPDPIIPDCGDAVRIENAIETINQLLMQRDTRSYIIDTVDDIMREMGYNVIGARDVTKKNGRKFHDELYSYSTGTAINIIYSSDGQITMELGGLSNNDNLPDENEAEILTEEMENFCESFSTIEKKLAERGVLVGSRISLAPPSAEYAMTINLNDYQLRSRNIQTLQDVIEKQENRNSGRGTQGKLTAD